jgi:hypothetical protein
LIYTYIYSNPRAEAAVVDRYIDVCYKTRLRELAESVDTSEQTEVGDNPSQLAIACEQ